MIPREAGARRCTHVRGCGTPVFGSDRGNRKGTSGSSIRERADGYRGGNAANTDGPIRDNHLVNIRMPLKR